MDDLTRALAHGEAGLNKISAGMSGDLGASAAWAAIEDATADQPQQMRQRDVPMLPLRYQLRIIAIAAVVLLVLILIR